MCVDATVRATIRRVSCLSHPLVCTQTGTMSSIEGLKAHEIAADETMIAYRVFNVLKRNVQECYKRQGT